MRVIFLHGALKTLRKWEDQRSIDDGNRKLFYLLGREGTVQDGCHWQCKKVNRPYKEKTEKNNNIMEKRQRKKSFGTTTYDYQANAKDLLEKSNIQVEVWAIQRSTVPIQWNNGTNDVIATIEDNWAAVSLEITFTLLPSLPLGVRLVGILTALLDTAAHFTSTDANRLATLFYSNSVHKSEFASSSSSTFGTDICSLRLHTLCTYHREHEVFAWRLSDGQQGEVAVLSDDEGKQLQDSSSFCWARLSLVNSFIGPTIQSFPLNLFDVSSIKSSLTLQPSLVLQVLEWLQRLDLSVAPYDNSKLSGIVFPVNPSFSSLDSESEKRLVSDILSHTSTRNKQVSLVDNGQEDEFEWISFHESEYNNDPNSLNDVYKSRLLQFAVVYCTALAAETDYRCKYDVAQGNIEYLTSDIRDNCQKNSHRTNVSMETNKSEELINRMCSLNVFRIQLNSVIIVDNDFPINSLKYNIQMGFSRQIRLIANSLRNLYLTNESQYKINHKFFNENLIPYSISPTICNELHIGGIIIKFASDLFFPSNSCFPLVIFNSDIPEVRLMWLIRTLNPLKPFFKPCCALKWDSHDTYQNKIICPHRAISNEPRCIAPGHRNLSIIPGKYLYFHYLQDGINDSGWGCAYRSLQTIISWYCLQGYVDCEIPSLWNIQEILKSNDPAHKNMQIGSDRWIGTIEGQYILNLLLGFQCKVIYLQCTDELESYTNVLQDHFIEQETPIMMGVREYAYTMIGICSDNSHRSKTCYLIVDPHYNGPENIKNIIEKGWVSWKTIDFFKKMAKGKFINLCLPQICKEDNTMVY